MSGTCIRVERRADVHELTLERAANRNSLTQVMLNELSHALSVAEEDSSCRLVVLRGGAGYFCTGMDFVEFVERAEGSGSSAGDGDVHYMDVLRQMSSMGRIVVSLVEGEVMAGGIGLLAASDLVLATPSSRFSLPEALWGLLPACVLPLLVRRVGFQNAYRLTLTTETWNSGQACASGLVDEVAEDLDTALRRHRVRLCRLDPSTVLRMKAYFEKIWYLTGEIEQLAVREIETLVRDPSVQRNIRNFVDHAKFPWEGRA